MADGVCAFFLGDLNDALGDQWTGKAGSQQITLIGRTCLHRRDDVIIDKFIGQIFDVQLGRTGLQRLFLQTVQFTPLPDIAAHRDDLTVIVFFQPWNEHRCVQSAGIRQYDLVVGFFHVLLLLSNKKAVLFKGRLARYHLTSIHPL